MAAHRPVFGASRQRHYRELQDKFQATHRNGEDQPLDVEVSVLIVDMTDFRTVDPEEIVKWIEACLGGDPAGA
jgi:hypothetical protein